MYLGEGERRFLFPAIDRAADRDRASMVPDQRNLPLHRVMRLALGSMVTFFRFGRRSFAGPTPARSLLRAVLSIRGDRVDGALQRIRSALILVLKDIKRDDGPMVARPWKRPMAPPQSPLSASALYTADWSGQDLTAGKSKPHDRNQMPRGICHSLRMRERTSSKRGISGEGRRERRSLGRGDQSKGKGRWPL